MNKKRKWRDKLFSLKWIYKTKKGFFLIIVPLFVVAILGSHEAAVRFFPDITCVACHEMKEPVKKWRDSETNKNHTNCAGCHFDAGIARVWEMNRRSAELFFVHFTRDAEEPIKPPAEPLFLDVESEPGYYSLVPNHRCFQCKDAKNHKQIDQPKIHGKLIKDISQQPCKDCHNHEMRNGQKFFEKVLPKDEQNIPRVATGEPLGVAQQ